MYRFNYFLSGENSPVPILKLNGLTKNCCTISATQSIEFIDWFYIYFTTYPTLSIGRKHTIIFIFAAF